MTRMLGREAGAAADFGAGAAGAGFVCWAGTTLASDASRTSDGVTDAIFKWSLQSSVQREPGSYRAGRRRATARAAKVVPCGI